jgi:hypothetical protein
VAILNFLGCAVVQQSRKIEKWESPVLYSYPGHSPGIADLSWNVQNFLGALPQKDQGRL